jgi:hypothetical protein
MSSLLQFRSKNTTPKPKSGELTTGTLLSILVVDVRVKSKKAIKLYELACSFRNSSMRPVVQFPWIRVTDGLFTLSTNGLLIVTRLVRTCKCLAAGCINTVGNQNGVAWARSIDSVLNISRRGRPGCIWSSWGRTDRRDIADSGNCVASHCEQCEQCEGLADNSVGTTEGRPQT